MYNIFDYGFSLQMNPTVLSEKLLKRESLTQKDLKATKN